MTGPHEVYVSDGHGVLTRLTPRLAAEALSEFWESYGIERHHMTRTPEHFHEITPGSAYLDDHDLWEYVTAHPDEVIWKIRYYTDGKKYGSVLKTAREGGERTVEDVARKTATEVGVLVQYTGSDSTDFEKWTTVCP